MNPPQLLRSGKQRAARPDETQIVPLHRPGEPLLTAEEVADFLRIPTKQVYGLTLLRSLRLSARRLRWRQSDLDAYIEQLASRDRET